MAAAAVGGGVTVVGGVALKMPTRVSVPVLSEKMYLICPSSSLRVVVRDFAGVSDSTSYILVSQLIHQL